MKRSELKSIIKECIFEIFADTFGRDDISRNLVSDGVLDESSFSTSSAKESKLRKNNSNKKPSAYIETIKSIIPENGVTSSNAMLDIFADTASTTLIEQVKGEKMNSTIDTGIDPTLFEGSKNWATLAFGDS